MKTNMITVSPFLWFDDQAEEATKFYASLFANSKIGSIARYTESSAKPSGKKPGSAMTVPLELEGLKILALNGGPMFRFTPSLSLFVCCTSEKEIDQLWNGLSKGGSVRMALGKYPFAEKYGFTTDRYGLDWQLILQKSDRKIVPAFLFVDQLFGRGKEAIEFYSSIFPNSKIEGMELDSATKTVRHCRFTLAQQQFVLMEGQGAHGFKFNEAFSLVVECETQAEIDHYWTRLTEGGRESQCGWLKDKFGVSWQITPRILPELMTSLGGAQSEKVMKAVMGMKKLDVAKLKEAFES